MGEKRKEGRKEGRKMKNIDKRKGLWIIGKRKTKIDKESSLCNRDNYSKPQPIKLRVIEPVPFDRSAKQVPCLKLNGHSEKEKQRL